MRMHELDDHVDSRKNHRPEPSSGYDFKTLLRFVVVALLTNMIWSKMINALLYGLMGVVDNRFLSGILDWQWLPRCLVMAWVYRRFVFKSKGRLLLGAASLEVAALVTMAVTGLLRLTPLAGANVWGMSMLKRVINFSVSYLLLSRLAYPAMDANPESPQELEEEEDRAWMHLTNRDDQDP